MVEKEEVVVSEAAEVVREKIYNEVKKEKKLVKEKKLKKILQQMVVEFGDVLLPFYVVVSSVWIAVSICMYVYGRGSNVFINYFNSGGGASIVSGFVFFGILMFVVWLSFGLMGIRSYKLYLQLRAKGLCKKKGLLGKILE